MTVSDTLVRYDANREINLSYSHCNGDWDCEDAQAETLNLIRIQETPFTFASVW